VAVKHPARGVGILDIYSYHAVQLPNFRGVVALAVDDELVEGVVDCDTK
jgi:hypothetical protein